MQTNHIKMSGNFSREFTTSLLAAIVIPLFLGLFARSIANWLYDVFFFIVLIFPFYILIRMIWEWIQEDKTALQILFRYVRPLPPGAIYNNELKQEGFPWITTGIIIINSIVFLLLPESWKDGLVFLPIGDPTVYERLFSVLTSAFLHADFSHLGFNMLFLWGFGSTLESRLGWKRFAGCYLAAIIGSNILVYLLLTIQASQLNQPELISEFHSLGASGAVSGIMGIFIVRCFFAQISFSVPLLMIPIPILNFFSIPFRIQAPILVGLFFTFDLAGSVNQFNLSGGHVNYWSHVGGYLTCIIIGISMGLHRETALDIAKTKSARYRRQECQSAETESSYNQLLTYEPENLEALNYLFTRHHQRNSSEAGKYFSRLLESSSTSDIKNAVELSREYLPRYLSDVSPKLAVRLGIHFFNNADLIPARLSFRTCSKS
jgi:membrane associated rhomboid family serine protease